jgi:flagellar hook-associated protein 2
MAVSNLSNGLGVIQAQGIGSGLDIQSLVQQLVQAEGAQVQARITREASRVGTDISALGSLKGALSSFQGVVTPLKSSTTLNALSATSTSGDTFTASADATAAAGNYSIEVTQLAKAEQIVTRNFTGGATTVMGNGTLTITVGASTMNVAIDASGNTLAAIRDKINNASNNPGVQAAIIGDAGGSRLVLTGARTGAANTIRITASGDAGLAQLAYAGGSTASWTNNQAAQSASVKVAGISFSSDTNAMTGVITGVTLNLKTASPGNTYALTVATDQTTIVNNVRKFVDGYNALQKTLTQLTGYNAATKTGGPMQGDPLAVGLAGQVRRLSFDVVPGIAGAAKSLAALGITSDSSGQLLLNEGKLATVLAQDRNVVTRLFGSADGIAARLDTALTGVLGSKGSIAARDSALASSQKSIERDKRQLNDRLQIVQSRYLAQFTALDSLMAKMKSTSSYLSQQLNSLNSVIGSSNGGSSG